MAKRILEYNVFASCKFDCPVISFVIYLKKESRVGLSQPSEHEVRQLFTDLEKEDNS